MLTALMAFSPQPEGEDMLCYGSCAARAKVMWYRQTYQGLSCENRHFQLQSLDKIVKEEESLHLFQPTKG